MSEHFDLVVFGANGLIGKSLCKYFLLRNVNVIAADISFSNLMELKDDFGGQLLLSETNATCIESVDKVFQENIRCDKIINLCYPRNQGYKVA